MIIVVSGENDMSERTRLKERKRAEQRARRKRRRIKRVTVLIAEILILSLLGGTAYIMAKYDKFQTTYFGKDEIKSNKGVELEGYMTVALFGGDSRDGLLEEGAHADTIIVAAINNDTKEVKLASVYRDTLTEQMNGKIQKANYAYFAGGPKDAINMLNKNFDLDIQKYVTVDFKVLADVIDLLGGIEVDVTDAEAKELNNYIDETAMVAGKKANRLASGGKQLLDGSQAVTYARIRKNVGGDFKRTERQQVVIRKVVEKAKTTNISTINKIINKVFAQISTNFTLNDMIGLAAGALDYRIGESTGFPMEAMNSRIEKVGSAIAPVGLVENVKELHEFLYPDDSYGEPSETVKSIAQKIEKLTEITREKLNDPNADITKSSFSIKQEEKQKQETE